MRQSLKKAVMVLGALVSIAAGTTYTSKIIAHNIMSNTGWTDDSGQGLTKASTYFTKGRYKGFSHVWSRTPQEQDIDLNAIYLGLEPQTLPLSPYRPHNLAEGNQPPFFSIKKYTTDPSRILGLQMEGVTAQGLEKIINLKEGEEIGFSEVSLRKTNPLATDFTTIDLNGYNLRFGRDKEGIYTSVQDSWDFVPNAGYFKDNAKRNIVHRLTGPILSILGSPIHFYDRYHWNDQGVSDGAIRTKVAELKANPVHSGDDYCGVM